MVETLKNLLLQNRQADFHETWYVALGLLPIIVCINDDPGVTSMTYFMARSNFVNLVKVKKADFSEIIAACDLKLMDLMKICEY